MPGGKNLLLKRTVFMGYVFIIPSLLRSKVLLELPNSHPGIRKMKSLAQIHVWWPNIDAIPADTVKSCVECQLMGSNPIHQFLCIHGHSKAEIGK